eukprot:scaffold451_cov208-Pinguiococcus_pyrenoidosus.AAC.4
MESTDCAPGALSRAPSAAALSTPSPPRNPAAKSFSDVERQTHLRSRQDQSYPGPSGVAGHIGTTQLPPAESGDNSDAASHASACRSGVGLRGAYGAAPACGAGALRGGGVAKVVAQSRRDAVAGRAASTPGL